MKKEGDNIDETVCKEFEWYITQEEVGNSINDDEMHHHEWNVVFASYCYPWTLRPLNCEFRMQYHTTMMEEIVQTQFEYIRGSKVIIPRDTTQLTFHPNVSYAHPNICSSHHDLVKVHFHGGIRSIGSNAFCSCKSLKEVLFAEGLERLEDYCAFANCSSLTRVSLPSTLIIIGKRAFASCTSLCEVEFAEVSLPASLETIGKYAFAHCTSLYGMELPFGTWLQLGEYFSGFIKDCEHVPIANGCRALVNVYLPRTIEHNDHHIFDCTWTVDTRQTLFALKADCDDYYYDDNCPRSYIHECLEDRFVDRPIHQACYHASKTAVDLLLEIINDVDTTTLLSAMTDGLGMTPFHIVATSAVLREDLFQVLLDTFPLAILEEKDRFDKTMMDYLLLNPSPKAIPLIQTVVEKKLLNLMSGWGHDNWKKELVTMVRNPASWEGAGGDINSTARRKRFQEIQNTFEWYKRIEEKTLLELALWKMKNPSSLREDEGRMTCGANLVIRNVTCFLFQQEDDGC